MSDFNSAVEYFKSSEVLITLMKEMAEKYYRYGEFKGTINKRNLLQPADLILFLGINQSQWQRNKWFKIVDFENTYKNSRFGKNNLNLVVESVVGHKLVTKEEIDAKNANRFQKFTEDLERACPKVASSLDTSKIKLYYNRGTLISDFSKVEKCFRNLPSEFTRLPVFSYQVLNDPHGLDRNKIVGQVFFEMLKQAINKEEIEENEIYLKFKIVKDDILNFVTVQNINANSNLFKAAVENETVWNVPLMEILNLDKVFPVRGNKVFLIENSSVYAVIINELKNIPLIMTSGQFKYATWRLLELLPPDVQIYYSSDLDPAGLIMSNRLIEKYGTRVHLFGMSETDYLENVENGTALTNQNISRMNSITTSQLLNLKNQIVEHKKAVYQEAQIPELITLIRRINSADKNNN